MQREKGSQDVSLKKDGCIEDYIAAHEFLHVLPN